MATYLIKCENCGENFEEIRSIKTIKSDLEDGNICCPYCGANNIDKVNLKTVPVKTYLRGAN